MAILLRQHTRLVSETITNTRDRRKIEALVARLVD
jgi:hypothetical protein